MIRSSGDHWQIGRDDLGRQASDLATAGIDAEVVLVELHVRRATPPDPDRDDRVLKALWQAATGVESDGLHGRRLSWRSFVLLVHGDSKAVRGATARALDGMSRGRDETAWHTSVHWTRSSGDFIGDVKSLETESAIDPA